MSFSYTGLYGQILTQKLFDEILVHIKKYAQFGQQSRVDELIRPSL